LQILGKKNRDKLANLAISKCALIEGFVPALLGVLEPSQLFTFCSLFFACVNMGMI